MAEHAIKGTGFQSVVASIEALRDSGELSPEELEARLTASDLAMLEAKVNPAGWYAVEAYERLMEIRIDSEGGSDPAAYLRRRGGALCERLISAGIYGQLEILDRMNDERIRDRFMQDVRLMSTMFGSMLNFATLTVGEDPETGFYLEISDAEGFPETLVGVILGFVDSLSRRITGDDGLYVSGNVSRDCIRVYRAP